MLLAQAFLGEVNAAKEVLFHPNIAPHLGYSIVKGMRNIICMICTTLKEILEEPFSINCDFTYIFYQA